MGGADHVRNKNAKCRWCHEAKHGDRIAPSVRWKSTGDMEEIEFVWFKQFVKEMITAMAELVDVRLEAKYGLKDREMWLLPLGDVKQLHAALKEADVAYNPAPPELFM